MPRPSKGARLYERADGTWSILDGKVERRTGTANRREAEEAFAQYIHARSRPSGPVEPEQMKIGDALGVYTGEHAPHAVAGERIFYAIMALTTFWGELTVSAITKNTCRRYAAARIKLLKDGTEQRISDGTVRRELGTLRAALNYCEGEGRLTRAPVVHLPDRPPPKDRWLTREEAARLLRMARRSDKLDKRGRRQRTDRGRHLAYFILIALYTGTRKEAILALGFEPHPSGGWIDCNSGVIYRRAQDMRETGKRKPPVRMPRKLLGHMKRLKANGQRWAVEYQGARIADVQTAWDRACRDAGIDGATPHSLRHTAITWAMQSGVPLADAAAFFGVTIEVLERVYFHHHPDFMVSTAEAMNRA